MYQGSTPVLAERRDPFGVSTRDASRHIVRPCFTRLSRDDSLFLSEAIRNVHRQKG